MPDTRVKLIIEAATKKAQAEVRKFTDASNKGLQSVANASKSAGAQMKAAWGAAKAAWIEALAVIYALKKAWDFAQDAARFKERAQAFHNMAASMGTDANKLLADLKQLSRGTISELTLMEKAGTAMSMDIPAERLKGLMKIARATAKVTGQTVEQAFSDISLGVARQSKMILDNLGIIVNVEKVNKEYAKSIGKAADALTDAEKKQAFLNATMKAGERIIKRVGIEAETTAEKMQRWKAHMADMKIVAGRVVTTVAIAIDTAFTSVGTAINYILSKVAEGWGEMLALASKLPVVGKYADVASKAVKAFGENSEKASKIGVAHLKDNLGAIKSVWKGIEANAKAAGKSQVNASNQAAEAAKKAKDEVKKLLDKEKEALDLRRQATEEMYQEAGIDAEAAARLEVQKLIEKTSKWEKAGVDILKINEYLHEKLGKMSEETWAKGEEELGDYYDYMQGKASVLVLEFQATQADVLSRLGAVDESLDKYRAVFIEDRASENLHNIKRLLDSIQDKTVHVNVVQSSGVGGGLSGGGDLPQRNIENDIANNIKYGRSPIPEALGG